MDINGDLDFGTWGYGGIGRGALRKEVCYLQAACLPTGSFFFFFFRINEFFIGILGLTYSFLWTKLQNISSLCDASLSRRIHGLSGCPVRYASGRSYECPRPRSRDSLVVQWLRLCASTRRVANYRATSCNSQSTVLFSNAGFWCVILCRTENKSKIWLKTEILNTSISLRREQKYCQELLRNLNFSDQGLAHTWPNQSLHNFHIKMP